MVKVAPSILSADFANLGRDIETIITADYIHFDVMDGVFVPNISVGLPVLESVRKITDMVIDVHLMIVEPVKYVERFVNAGGDIVVVHYEADTPVNIERAINIVKSLGKKAGVAIKPATPASAVENLVPLCDMILVMTVEPGFGGQSFMADQVKKIRQIREMIMKANPSCRLEVDGGINPQTAAECIKAGADVLVAGSDVFKAEDRAGRIEILRRAGQN